MDMLLQERSQHLKLEKSSLNHNNSDTLSGKQNTTHIMDGRIINKLKQ